MKGFGYLILVIEKIKNKNNSLDINLFIYGYIPKTYIKTYSRNIINFDEFKRINQDWVTTYPKFLNYTKIIKN